MLNCMNNPLCMFWTSVYVNSYNCPIQQIPASLDVITPKSKKIANEQLLNRAFTASNLRIISKAISGPNDSAHKWCCMGS